MGIPPFANSPTLPATFARPGKVRQILYNVLDYGATNAQQVKDAVLSGTTVTSVTANFNASDVGKIIFAANTTNDIKLFTTTITAYVSPTQVTVAAGGTNGSSYTLTWGYDSTVGVKAAVAAAGLTGGSVKYPDGNYIVSDVIVWDKRSLTKSCLGPSMIGADGRSGPSPDFGQLGVVQIICDPTNFPLGEYIFDFLGPTAQDKAICGVMVRGFVFACNARGAGIRLFNCFSTNLSDFIIGASPATPNPAIPGAFSLGTSNTGAVVDSASPTQNSFYNTFERIFVQGAAVDGFQMAGGAGSYSLMANCMANNCGRFGYNLTDKITLVACHAQANAQTDGLSGADYNVGRYDIALIGCIVYAGKPKYGNGVKLAGGASAIAHFVGCTFYGAANPDHTLTDPNAAVIQILGNIQKAQFTACTFATGNSTFTSNFINQSQFSTGRVSFDNCHFLTEYGDALTGAPINFNGTYEVLSVTNSHGINPLIIKPWGNLTNARQGLRIGLTGGVPSGGTFTLSWGGNTTSALAYSASAITIQTALRALASIGGANINVTGSNINSNGVTAEFVGTLAGAAQAAITANSSGLTPTGLVTITTILSGGSSVSFTRVDGNLQTGTLTGNIMPTISNGIIIGDILTFEFTQDSTGSRICTWPGNVINGPVLSTAINAVDLISLSWDGTNWRRVSEGLSRPYSITEGGTGNIAGAASALSSATTTIDVVASAAPSTGQALIATDSTHATWQTLGSGGTVTTASIVSANGFAGTVANPTTTPALTLSTTITGLLKGNGTAISAAVSNTDYAPSASPSLTGTVTLGDGVNMALGTTTGTTIGTATTQKLGFFNATPIVQAANTTDLRTLLVNFGLLASGGATPLNLNGGAFTTSGTVSCRQITITDAFNIIVGSTTGTKIGTATTQKLGFFNATPIVQEANTIDLGTVLSDLGLRAAGTAYPITTTAAVSTGNLTLGTAGNKLSITTGSNASAGTGTLVAGTATISTTAVTANSLIFLTDTASSITNVGTLTVSAKTAGTSFVVTSTLALDTSTFNWLIIN